MRRLTLGLAPGFLAAPPNTGAGRVHHSVIAELYPRLARRPRAWRRPEVWLFDAGAGEFRPGQPVVAVCHGAEWLVDPSLYELAPEQFWRPLVARVERGVRSATLTIVPSEYTRAALIAGWDMDPQRVIAVHHGVDRGRFTYRPGGRRLVAEGLGTDRPYIAFVGVASLAKGILQLKEAMARLARKGYPHALVVAGPLTELEPEEWRDQVGQEIEGAPGRLCWIENATDEQLAPLLSDADALCLPSVKESFGLPVVEAMACGAPVVVANRAALPEVVGDAGLLCDPTADGIATALRQVLEDPALARTLAEKGRARAKLLSWERTARGWLAALERAVNLAPAT